MNPSAGKSCTFIQIIRRLDELEVIAPCFATRQLACVLPIPKR